MSFFCRGKSTTLKKDRGLAGGFDAAWLVRIVVVWFMWYDLPNLDRHSWIRGRFQQILMNPHSTLLSPASSSFFPKKHKKPFLQLTNALDRLPSSRSCAEVLCPAWSGTSTLAETHCHWRAAWAAFGVRRGGAGCLPPAVLFKMCRKWWGLWCVWLEGATTWLMNANGWLGPRILDVDFGWFDGPLLWPELLSFCLLWDNAMRLQSPSLSL